MKSIRCHFTIYWDYFFSPVVIIIVKFINPVSITFLEYTSLEIPLMSYVNIFLILKSKSCSAFPHGALPHDISVLENWYQNNNGIMKEKRKISHSSHVLQNLVLLLIFFYFCFVFCLDGVSLCIPG